MSETLVTAATGTVGQHVVRELVDAGEPVRAATRDPERGQMPDGAMAVQFDFAHPETWGPALDGVDRVFLVRPPGVDVGDVTAFVQALSRVGIDHVAYLSTLGADRNPLIPHYRIERSIREAGVPATMLRASFFAQNLHEVHGADLRERGEISVPAGTGRTSFVDARDVAAVAAHVLTSPGHRGVAYDVTGPAALTYYEVARTFSEALDREITYTEPSIPAFVRRVRAQGEPLGFALLMVAIYTTARLRLAGRVTDDVERLLDRPPRSIRDYAVDYREELLGTAESVDE